MLTKFFCYYVTKVARELTFPKIKDFHNSKRQKQNLRPRHTVQFSSVQPLSRVRLFVTP